LTVWTEIGIFMTFIFLGLRIIINQQGGLIVLF